MDEKNDFINTVLKKENDKYIGNNLKDSDKFSINANLNMKINQKELLQMKEIENKPKINLNNQGKNPIEYAYYKNNNINQNNLLEKQNNIAMNPNPIVVNPNQNIIINNNINQVKMVPNNINTNIQLNQNNIPIYNKTFTNLNMNNNIRYENPHNTYNAPFLNTPENYNRVMSITSQMNNNQQKMKHYTVKQVNTYRSIYDNEQNKNL